jgi:hypothetical protein
MAFDGSRTDNGCPITAWVQTKSHNFGTQNLKRFRYSDMHLMECLGDVDIAGDFASEKGAYQRVLNKRIAATPGEFGVVTEFDNNTLIESFRPQTRYVKTRNNDDKSNDCNLCGVESDLRNYVGMEFSMVFAWSGRMALRDYRIFVQPNTDDEWNGKIEKDETDPNILTEQGCSSKEPTTDAQANPVYFDAATSVVDCPYGQTGNPSIGMASRTSNISMLDAEKRANCAAYQDALSFLQCE